ncbi:hypothetical protein ACNRDB_12515 [Ralstonia pseudosolanacearum]|uniref:hypothetical protein n=1 Tax=Ralstonia pseudosolanacearum TaxID=1310165 RepID=UPI001E61A6ED|nr:hypothetical protein [Ralstonia pseudosolanacearum]
MGIIDFREISSPKADHTSGKEAPIGISNLPDDFELFCQDFFKLVRKMKVFASVSNGPDNGMDLGVEGALRSGSTVRWLVSCKHKAHSRKPVSEDEEKNIIERVSKWKCDGFIPFYTTVPSEKVATLIEGVESFGKRVERYSKERIEQELLSSPEGIQLAARYFPKSMVNHYGKIIGTAQVYTADDIIIDGGFLMAPGVKQYVSGATEEELAKVKEHLKHYANLRATMRLHAPYFQAALKDAIQLAPEFFQIDRELIELKDFAGVKPTWCAYSLYRAGVDGRGLAFTYFVAAVWSFWDWSRAHQAFAETMAWRNYLGYDPLESEIEECKDSEDFKSLVDHYKASGLLSPGLVAIKLQEEMRDILTRLVAYANPIPQGGE